MQKVKTTNGSRLFYIPCILIAMVFCLYRAADVVELCYLFFYYLNSGVNVNVSDFLISRYTDFFVFLFSFLVFFSVSLMIYFKRSIRVLELDVVEVEESESGKFDRSVQLAGACLFIMFFVVFFMLLYEKYFCAFSGVCDAQNWREMFADAFFMLVAVIASLFALSKFRYSNFKVNLALHRVPLKFYLKTFFVLMAFYFVMLCFLHFFIGSNGGEGLVVNNDHMKSGNLILLLVITALFTPIMEELVFRGYIQGKFSEIITSPWVGIVVASLLFSVMHYDYPYFTLWQVFMFSLLLGWARMNSGSVFPAIFMHIIFNAIGVLASYYL